MKGSLLIADDEFGIREFLFELFKEDYRIYLAEDGEEAVEKLEKNIPDVALLDMRMPGKNGIDVLRFIREKQLETVPIVITADREVDHAVESMKLGAFDYVTKPVDYKKISILVKNALEKKRLTEKLHLLEKEIIPNFAFSNIIGESPAMKSLFQQVENVLNNDASVLIYGESGTGKELFAKAIHYNGNRAKAPFIPVDCAALPGTLIEAALFGYEKGAFTGAQKTTKGKFELADGGTLFLDEIANISVDVQAKLLRVLQEKTFSRVGGQETIHVDVRVLSASNRDLGEMIADGQFREDLFYRLNVVPITLPPLRERSNDIPLLIKHFLALFNEKYKKSITLSAGAMRKMLAYSWPGNIRELENLINRMVLSSKSTVIKEEDLPIEEKHDKKFSPTGILQKDMPLEELETIYINELLKRHNHNVTRVAEILGVTRKTIYTKIKKLVPHLPKKTNQEE